MKTNNGSSKFCDIILNLIHPEDEISEAEGLYALACAYGLDEVRKEENEGENFKD